MNLAIRIAAAILSVPPDVLAPMIPMVAPPPRTDLEARLRWEVDSALSGDCCSVPSLLSPVATRGENEEEPQLFTLSKDEANFVVCQSGNPSSLVNNIYRLEEERVRDHAVPQPLTYGEITMLGARQLFHHMGLSFSVVMPRPKSQKSSDEPQYNFYDLGSGGGRLVLHAYLELVTLSQSVGIELLSSRHAVARQTLEDLVQSGKMERIKSMAAIARGRAGKEGEDSLCRENDVVTNVDGTRVLHHCHNSKLELLQGDLFELDISQATHIFISSLCFSDDMLHRLVKKIEMEAEKLQIVASLRLLPLEVSSSSCEKGNYKAVLGSNPWMEFVEMSWTKARGDGCPVYFYSVNNNCDL